MTADKYSYKHKQHESKNPFLPGIPPFSGSQRRGSVTARLMGLRVRIPPGAWMSVSCDCCVLSRRGLRAGLITRPLILVCLIVIVKFR